MINVNYYSSEIERVSMTLKGLPFVDDVTFTAADGIAEFGAEIRVYDALGTVSFKDGSAVPVVLEAKRNVWPSTIGEVIDAQPSDADTVYAVVSPRISEEVRSLLQSAGISWFDGVGNCYFESRRGYALITGTPYQKAPRKDASAFERSAAVSSRVLRRLLVDASRYWRVAELAREAESSVGMVSRVKQFLDRRGFLDVGEEGFRPANVPSLMEEWARIYNRKAPEATGFYSFDDVAALEAELARLELPVYLTGPSGGVRYAPAIRYGSVDAYVPLSERDSVVQTLGLRPVESGANFKMHGLDEGSVLLDARVVRGNRVVSPVQAYLDCMANGARGEEEARAILEKEIVR